MLSRERGQAFEEGLPGVVSRCPRVASTRIQRQAPAQVLVSIAAGRAFLAVLTRRCRATRSEWLTVRVLLAGKLIVFAVSYEDHLGVALAATAILSGLGLVSERLGRLPRAWKTRNPALTSRFARSRGRTPGIRGVRPVATSRQARRLAPGGRKYGWLG